MARATSANLRLVTDPNTTRNHGRAATVSGLDSAGRPVVTHAAGERINALSAKRQLFVAEYLKDFNGTQAAIRAGYSANGAKATASRFLARDEIAVQIKATVQGALDGSKMTLERWVEEVSRRALAEFTELFDDNDQPLPIKKMPREHRVALAGIKDGPSGREIRAHSAAPYFGMLMKYFKIGHEFELSGDGGGPVNILTFLKLIKGKIPDGTSDELSATPVVEVQATPMIEPPPIAIEPPAFSAADLELARTILARKPRDEDHD